MVFLRCVFARGFSSAATVRTACRRFGICMAFRPYGCVNGSSSRLPLRMQGRKSSICSFFRQSGASCATIDLNSGKMNRRICYSGMVSPVAALSNSYARRWIWHRSHYICDTWWRLPYSAFSPDSNRPVMCRHFVRFSAASNRVGAAMCRPDWCRPNFVRWWHPLRLDSFRIWHRRRVRQRSVFAVAGS